MKTFVVLIRVEGSLVEPREVCESLEGTKFHIGGSVQATAIDVLHNIMLRTKDELGSGDSSDIEVEPLSDFMDRFNNQELNPDDYYMSYVYA